MHGTGQAGIRRVRFSGGAVTSEYIPQPRLWLIPILAVVVLIGGAWLADTLSAGLVALTGQGEPTSYLPEVRWGLAVVVVVGVAGFAWLLLRRPDSPVPSGDVPLPAPVSVPAPPSLASEPTPDFLVGEVLADSKERGYQPITPDLIA